MTQPLPPDLQAAERTCRHCGKPIHQAARGDMAAIPGSWVHENGYPYCGLYAEPAQEDASMMGPAL